jgi:nicotinate phosphoribosyltransferase
MASGDLDEHEIARLIAVSAPIDGFGVGTELITSRDAPALSMVYKLVEIEGKGRIKLSPNKRVYPMAKQVFRRRDERRIFQGDLVARADESAAGEPLLVEYVRQGRLLQPLPSLEAIRGHHSDQQSSLPDRLKSLEAACDYPVEYSDLLEAEARRLMEQGS